MSEPGPRLVLRLAVRQDVPQLVELGRAMHQESTLSFLPFSERKVIALAERMIMAPQSCCVFVAQQSDNLVGFIAGQLTDYFFCDEYFALDQGLYVSPIYRGSTAAYRLIKAYLDWAYVRRAREACIAVSTGVNMEATGRILEKFGMNPVGGIYKLRTEDVRQMRGGQEKSLHRLTSKRSECGDSKCPQLDTIGS